MDFRRWGSQNQNLGKIMVINEYGLAIGNLRCSIFKNWNNLVIFENYKNLSKAYKNLKNLFITD